MATEERVENLKTSCEQLKDMLDRAEKHRDRLIDLSQQGYSAAHNTKQDLFPEMIQEADFTAQTSQKILTHMDAILSRALNGEDV